MAIEFSCECGQRMTARSSRAGEAVACPKCGEVLTVPARASGLAEAAAILRTVAVWTIRAGLVGGLALGLMGAAFGRTHPANSDDVAVLVATVCLAGLAASLR